MDRLQQRVKQEGQQGWLSTILPHLNSFIPWETLPSACLEAHSYQLTGNLYSSEAYPLFIDSLTFSSPLSLPVILAESYLLAGAVYPEPPVLTITQRDPSSQSKPSPSGSILGWPKNFCYSYFTYENVEALKV